jgi:hypothetical protein
MKKLIAVTLLILTTLIVGARAQTTTKKPKHPTVQQNIEAVQPAVSDAFAKTALHFLIAMRDSDGSTVAAGHIATIYEDLEIGQSTPTEESLRQLFALKDINHRFFLKYQMQKELRRDGECFNIYIKLLKVNDSETDWNKKYSECDLGTVPNPANKEVTK